MIALVGPLTSAPGDAEFSPSMPPEGVEGGCVDTVSVAVPKEPTVDFMYVMFTDLRIATQLASSSQDQTASSPPSLQSAIGLLDRMVCNNASFLRFIDLKGLPANAFDEVLVSVGWTGQDVSEMPPTEVVVLARKGYLLAVGHAGFVEAPFVFSSCLLSNIKDPNIARDPRYQDYEANFERYRACVRSAMEEQTIYQQPFLSQAEKLVNAIQRVRPVR